MTKLTNAPETVRLELAPENLFAHHACDLCGWASEKPSLLAEVLDGELAGFRVCEDCLRRASAGESLDSMLEARAKRVLADAKEEAAGLRSLVGRLHAPTHRDWVRARFEHLYAATRAECEHVQGDGGRDKRPRLNHAKLLDLLVAGITQDGSLAPTDEPIWRAFALASAIADGSVTPEDVLARALELDLAARIDMASVPF